MKWLVALISLHAADLLAAEKQAKVSARIEAIAQMLTPTQRMKLLDLLNKGRDDSLRSLPGIGETRLAAIKQARPFNDITEVTKVPGVGEGTFIDFVKHAKAGFPKK
jgi:DNA uptake protein ComE-like DNA-binding protein